VLNSFKSLDEKLDALGAGASAAPGQGTKWLTDRGLPASAAAQCGRAPGR
jgi:hypothetical protein